MYVLYMTFKNHRDTIKTVQHNTTQIPVCVMIHDPVCMCPTLQVAIDLVKQPGRTLGFSIAGGKGSTPAYEDVDEVRLYENTGAKGMYICTMYMCMM